MTAEKLELFFVFIDLVCRIAWMPSQRQRPWKRMKGTTVSPVSVRVCALQRS